MNILVFYRNIAHLYRTSLFSIIDLLLVLTCSQYIKMCICERWKILKTPKKNTHLIRNKVSLSQQQQTYFYLLSQFLLYRPIEINQDLLNRLVMFSVWYIMKTEAQLCLVNVFFICFRAVSCGFCAIQVLHAFLSFLMTTKEIR